tara:strand:- start:99 stop:239 length:141 start_codon:yes stop_codon:yes gene_type:complete
MEQNENNINNNLQPQLPTPNSVREAKLFDVIIEFYVKKVELKFSYN